MNQSVCYLNSTLPSTLYLPAFDPVRDTFYMNTYVCTKIKPADDYVVSTWQTASAASGRDVVARARGQWQERQWNVFFSIYFFSYKYIYIGIISRQNNENFKWVPLSMDIGRFVSSLHRRRSSIARWILGVENSIRL